MKSTVIRFFVLSLCAAIHPYMFAQETLPSWSEGILDLHFIATGRGDCSFYVLPDGTRILCDAGDVGSAWQVAQPDSSMTPGEWIAKYIKDFSDGLPGSPDVVDYFYLTHYHGDHIGTPQAASSGKHGYMLSGITMVGEQIHFNKIIDRDCETHSFPSENYYLGIEPFIRDNYFTFCTYQRDSCGTVLEKFRIGDRKQFRLIHNPKPYEKVFEIYNIASNGYIHTGKGHKTRPMFDENPEIFDENMFSCVFLMKYGKFTYFNGGDIPGGPFSAFNARHRDFESQVADLIGGHVTMIKPDHHGWKDSVNPYFLNVLSPDVVVVMCSQTEHPYLDAFLRLIDPLSKGFPRRIYFTTDGSRRRMGRELWHRLAGMEQDTPDCSLRTGDLCSEILVERLSDELWSHVNPQVGHIVVRVYPGGNSYQIFVLDAKEPGYKVLHSSEMVNL